MRFYFFDVSTVRPGRFASPLAARMRPFTAAPVAPASCRLNCGPYASSGKNRRRDAGATGSVSLQSLKGFHDFRGVPLGFGGFPDFFHFSAGTDQDRAAHDSEKCFSEKTLDAAGVVSFDDREVRIAEQREVESLLGLEFRLRVHRIGAAAKDNRVELVEFRFHFSKLDCLCGASRRARLGVKI